MDINPVVLDKIFSTAAQQNVKNFFSKLPDSAFIASTTNEEVPGYGDYVLGLLDGLRVFLLLQGHEVLEAERIRDYIWSMWPDLRA